jgi:hypothetical protein
VRTVGECFNRGGLQLDPARQIFREEGLGFSIGGWHPFRVNTYLPTLKKLDPLANTSIGKAVWKPIEKVNQSINKDFAKGKVWAQDHRKQLQIAAAVAAAAFGGAYFLGYLGTAGTEAAAAAAAESAATAAAAGEGASVVASTSFIPEALAPLATTGTEAAVSIAPAVVGSPVATAAASYALPEAAAAASGGSMLGTAGSIAQSLAPLAALSKLVGGGQAQPQQGYGYDAYGGYGFGSSGGGGGLGPMGPVDPNAPPAPVSSTPAWLLPAAGAALLFLLVSER